MILKMTQMVNNNIYVYIFKQLIKIESHVKKITERERERERESNWVGICIHTKVDTID